MNTKVYIRRDYMFGDNLLVSMGHRTGNDGPWAVALPLQYKVRTIEDEGRDYAPAFELDRDSAQRFMDELWNCGIRPTEGTGSAGSLAATQRHLEDMRHLVFKKNPL